MTILCPSCNTDIGGILELHIVLEKNNIIAIFDSQMKAESYANALGRKTKIKRRMLNRPIELVPNTF